jgi:hypothetical protein
MVNKERILVKSQNTKNIWLVLIVLALAILSCSIPGIDLFSSNEDSEPGIVEQLFSNEDLSQTQTSIAIAQQNLQATQQAAVIQAEGTATALAFQMESTATAQALAIQSTATAQAQAIQATANAQARIDAIMAYEYFDPFNANIYDWREDQEDNNFWAGSTSIGGGIYSWNITTVYDSFVSWADFEEFSSLGDFDVALRGRLVAGETDEHCYGILFRKSPDDFDDGSYSLSVCENGYFKIAYYSAVTGWDNITDWTESDAIIDGDWNLIEVSARGTNYTVFINSQQVADVSDPRLAGGKVSILVDVYELIPGYFEFDFFALQRR